MSGKVVTFYSYGGAGRSMALANVAVRLAKLGLRVIAVDWDLPAPSLHYWLRVKDADAPSTKGLLEFFDDWRLDIDRNAPVPPEALFSLRDAGVEHGQGDLRVLLAGRLDKTYGARMDAFDVRAFYSVDSGGGAVETLREELTKNADVVLVDSRSGMTDIGGVTAIQLPDGIVFVSLPNERCYQGSRSVASGILKGAPESDRVGRPKPTTWFVLSRGPHEKSMIRDWLAAHDDSFAKDVKDGLWTGRHPLGIASYYLPESARWAFGESIVPETPTGPDGTLQQSDPLATGYDKLAGELAAWIGGKSCPTT